MAALVSGGNCSSLSVTSCRIGNLGALALAKACRRVGLEALCLDSCGIGNAGAIALALALGRGVCPRALGVASKTQ